MKKEARLALRLDPVLAGRVKTYARSRSTTVSKVITKLLEELVKADDRAHGAVETTDAEQV